ncbi:MAG: GxxExxY protein [Gemmatimonadota bacterium]
MGPSARAISEPPERRTANILIRELLWLKELSDCPSAPVFFIAEEAAMEEDRLTSIIIASAIKVHKALGPGLLESAYRNGLGHDLKLQKLRVEMEKTLPLVYDGIRTRKGYRLDLLVENKIVVEVKAAKAILPIDLAQMQTYLTLTESPVGLIINFNVRWLKDGIKRVINPRR